MYIHLYILKYDLVRVWNPKVYHDVDLCQTHDFFKSHHRPDILNCTLRFSMHVITLPSFPKQNKIYRETIADN